MKKPEKRDRIAEEFSARIIGGMLSPGSRLPTEQKLAEILRVSRDTVRSAMQVLENRALIERIPGQGTFVRKSSDKNRIITFLLPCAEVLAGRIGYRAAMITRELLSGAIREGGKLQYRVETIAVSPTNRNDEIDWNALSHLNSSSRIIIYSNWYQPLFPFFREIGARTVLITHSEFASRGKRIAGGQMVLRGDSAEVCGKANMYLRQELSCRKICMLPPSEIEAGWEFFDLIRPMPFTGRIFYRSADQDRDFRNALRKIYDAAPFDGLFLQLPYLHEYHYERALNDNLGLPDGVRVLIYLHNPYEALRNVPSLNFDFRGIGAAAVRALCTGKPENTEQVFHPFINQYST